MSRSKRTPKDRLQTAFFQHPNTKMLWDTRGGKRDELTGVSGDCLATVRRSLPWSGGDWAYHYVVPPHKKGSSVSDISDLLAQILA